MIRRRKTSDHVSHDRWLVSYADFITLLFALFVVMYATSQTDKAKASQVSASVQAALEKGRFSSAVKYILGGTVDEKGMGNAQFKGPGGVHKMVLEKQKEMRTVDLATSLSTLTEELKRDIEAGKIDVTMQPRGLAISFNQAAVFPSGEDTVMPEAYEPLQRVASALLKIPNPVRLEGHTDSVPIHSARFRSNWELSASRSIALLELFSTRYGVPRERMSISGYAETAPLDTNETEEGRARNRRVDLVILNEAGIVAEPGFSPQANTPKSR
jgi:chemotaxis protein MotB